MDIRRNETNFPVLRLLGHRVAEQHEALQPRAEEQEADGVVVVYEVAAKRAGDITLETVYKVTVYKVKSLIK